MPDKRTDPVKPNVNPPSLLVGMRTLYDYWSAAYRGLEPHNVNSPAPIDTQYDEPETFDDAEQESIINPDVKPNSLMFKYEKVIPIPVVVIDDLHSTRRHTETYFTAYSELVQAVNPQLVVSRHSSRISLRLSNNGPGIVYLGHNESVLLGGYAMAVNEALTLTTTRDVWAIQQTGQVSAAALSIMYEYDKEIV